MAAWNILKKKNKLLSGVMLLWFAWSLPALLPLLLDFLMRAVFLNGRYVYDEAGNAKQLAPNPANEWIHDHWQFINTCNLLRMVLLVAIVLTPLVRKWQPNPEE